MTKLIESKSYIDSKLENLKVKCSSLRAQGLAPKLEVILVGNNSASQLYIKNKKIMCKKVGAEFSLVELDESTSKEEFLKHVQKMNNDATVTGCFVQLPVPRQLQDIDITELINPDKDVDGFHSKNIISLYKRDPQLTSCTPKGIVTLLKHYNIPISSQNIVIIGRGMIVGKPLALLLQSLDATVTVCHSKTKDIKIFTKQADVIICAIGRENFLDKSFLNKDKEQTIIDVGINKDAAGKLCGDVDFESVKDEVSAITPVPGGVGPMTVFSLIENLLLATQNIISKGNK